MRESQKSKFIMTVRRYPLLYDQNHMDYNKHFKKDEIWDKIASDFSMHNGGVAKLQWKRMRDKFRETLKKKIVPQGRRRANMILDYNFQRQMSFLIPFTTVGRCDTFYIPINGDGKYFEEESFYRRTIHDDIKADYSQRIYKRSREKKNDISPWLSQAFMDNKILFNKQRNKFMDILNQKMQQKAYAQNQTKTQKLVRKMDEFFRSMCETTKNLPKIHQLEIKKKLFDMVINAEERYSISVTCNNQTSKKHKMKHTVKNVSHIFLDESASAFQYSGEIDHSNENFLTYNKKISTIYIAEDVDDIEYFKSLLPYVKQLPTARKLFLRTEFENKIVAGLEAP